MLSRPPAIASLYSKSKPLLGRKRKHIYLYTINSIGCQLKEICILQEVKYWIKENLEQHIFIKHCCVRPTVMRTAKMRHIVGP